MRASFFLMIAYCCSNHSCWKPCHTSVQQVFFKQSIPWLESVDYHHKQYCCCFLACSSQERRCSLVTLCLETDWTQILSCSLWVASAVESASKGHAKQFLFLTQWLQLFDRQWFWSTSLGFSYLIVNDFDQLLLHSLA